MTLRVRPEAGNDIADAARWYESRESGLGTAYVAEIDAVFERISAGPLRYPILHKSLRRALVRRFPYAIYFMENGDDIIVFAVLHQRRNRDILDERTK